MVIRAWKRVKRMRFLSDENMVLFQLFFLQVQWSETIMLYFSGNLKSDELLIILCKLFETIGMKKYCLIALDEYFLEKKTLCFAGL